MDMVPVDSSNVHSVGYDPATKTMRIAFHGKDGEKSYDYADVPADVHAALMASSSKGSFVAKSIRGKFSHTKV